ncbi:hypothetical protein IG631_14140 [Alternaria alternata]|nr:hypothetical protein IG631_14140 [Alternaria alternata]
MKGSSAISSTHGDTNERGLDHLTHNSAHYRCLASCPAAVARSHTSTFTYPTTGYVLSDYTPSSHHPRYGVARP